MKFKDKDGNVFEDIAQVLNKYCYRRYCSDCEFYPMGFQGRGTCGSWVETHLTEAARLMGYDVVEDELVRNVDELETNTDKQEFELVTFLETEQERFIQNNISGLRSPMRLDWLQRLELSKAMLGRGVSEKTAWQIIRDFQVRMDSLKELIK